MTKHNRIRVTRTDLDMAKPTVLFYQRTGSPRNQIYINNPAARLRQTGLRKKIPSGALLPFWKGFLQRFNHRKITVVVAYRPAVARPPFRNPIDTLPFKAGHLQPRDYLFPADNKYTYHLWI